MHNICSVRNMKIKPTKNWFVRLHMFIRDFVYFVVFTLISKSSHVQLVSRFSSTSFIHYTSGKQLLIYNQLALLRSSRQPNHIIRQTKHDSTLMFYTLARLSGILRARSTPLWLPPVQWCCSPLRRPPPITKPPPSPNPPIQPSHYRD